MFAARALALEAVRVCPGTIRLELPRVLAARAVRVAAILTDEAVAA
jgi:hypothetical protein